MNSGKNILIVGIGNTIRGDDGIGAYIAAGIEQLHLEGVHTLVTQQLHTALLDEFLPFDSIVLVDAAIAGEPVSFFRFNTTHSVPASSSHHVNASLLVALAQQLYQKELVIMICAVKATHFDMGESLSVGAKQYAELAIKTICAWIQKA
jgi:hydrogenase maturation protease